MLRTCLATLGGAVLAAALLGAGVAWSGLVTVAATEPHPPSVAWALETAMERSVRRHATAIAPPPLANAKRGRRGFRAYDALCVGCHGAPGVEPAALAEGLLPPPPALEEAAGEWAPAELFWITKHGVRRTGMPGFGPTHDDAALWDVVAFLQELPELGPEHYAALRARAAAEGEDAAPAADGEKGGAHEHGEHSPAPRALAAVYTPTL